ncbi:MAG: hypothetical protein QXJ56_01180 [Ignisphaera sp.]|uniref:ArnR1-like winged helix-turn-helix domain-containing protein n=1 Tax=Ignisphaera aggregans TaxID=334771 RepID=A0A7J3JT95_9CREN
MALETSYITRLETLISYTEALDTASASSFTIEELAKLWGTNMDKTKTIVRKLKREGFLRRTRRGRYKLTLAGKILVRLYKRIKK